MKKEDMKKKLKELEDPDELTIDQIYKKVVKSSKVEWCDEKFDCTKIKLKGKDKLYRVDDSNIVEFADYIGVI